MNKTTKESPLRYVEKELQLISLDPLAMFDREGIILDVNEATIQATGRTREELIGTPICRSVHRSGKGTQRCEAGL